MEKINKTKKSIESQKPIMFIGEYWYNLDDKNRLTLPPKFRDSFSKGAILTKGEDGCLYVYTPTEWQRVAEKIATLPMNIGNNRAYSRLMLGGAMDLELDGNSRIIIPEYLREYAKLKKETVVVGLYSRLEIWDLETWRNYKLKMESTSEAIAEQLLYNIQ